MHNDHTGGGFEVRDARPTDAGAVTDLLQGIYKEHDYFVGASAAPRSFLRSRIEHAHREESLFLVATASRDAREKVLGWLELHRQAAVRLQHVATLTLAVDRSARRGGIGRALLRRSYDWCVEVGVNKISLNVRESNSAAIALYLSEGFELEGRERLAVRLGPLREIGAGGQAAPPAEAASYEDNLIMARFVGAD